MGRSRASALVLARGNIGLTRLTKLANAGEGKRGLGLSQACWRRRGAHCSGEGTDRELTPRAELGCMTTSAHQRHLAWTFCLNGLIQIASRKKEGSHRFAMRPGLLVLWRMLVPAGPGATL